MHFWLVFSLAAFFLAAFRAAVPHIHHHTTELHPGSEILLQDHSVAFISALKTEEECQLCPLVNSWIFIAGSIFLFILLRISTRQLQFNSPCYFTEFTLLLSTRAPPVAHI